MLNKEELQQLKDKINIKHSKFFASSKTTIDNFIYENNGELFFRAGIVLNIEVWEDIRMTLGIEYSPSEETYPKK